MKTAIDLPDDLVIEIKIESARRGRKLKDLIVELLRAGLEASRSEPSLARLTKDPKTGLPVVAGTRPARPEAEITPMRVAEHITFGE